jgi:hypothetical protein
MRVFGILLSLAVVGLLIGRGTTQEPKGTEKENTAGTRVAKEKAKPARGPAPRFFTVTEIGDDNIAFREFASKGGRRTIIDYVPGLKATEIYDGGGKKITAEECRKRVKVGSVVLVASENKKPDSAYFTVLKDDAVVLVPKGILSEGQPIKGQR